MSTHQACLVWAMPVSQISLVIHANGVTIIIIITANDQVLTLTLHSSMYWVAFLLPFVLHSTACGRLLKSAKILRRVLQAEDLEGQLQASERQVAALQRENQQLREAMQAGHAQLAQAHGQAQELHRLSSELQRLEVGEGCGWIGWALQEPGRVVLLGDHGAFAVLWAFTSLWSVHVTGFGGGSSGLDMAANA